MAPPNALICREESACSPRHRGSGVLKYPYSLKRQGGPDLRGETLVVGKDSVHHVGRLPDADTELVVRESVLCLLRQASPGDQEALISAVRGHDAMQLVDDRAAYLGA